MERKPHSTGSIVGAVVLFVVVLLGLYVGGYFALGEYRTGIRPIPIVAASVVYRGYRYDWLAYIFHPVARVEGAATGNVAAVSGPTIIYFSDGVVWQKSHGIWQGQ